MSSSQLKNPIGKHSTAGGEKERGGEGRAAVSCGKIVVSQPRELCMLDQVVATTNRHGRENSSRSQLKHISIDRRRQLLDEHKGK